MTILNALKALYEKKGGTNSTADTIAEAIEEITTVAGGGGGSSDFTTANITLITGAYSIGPWVDVICILENDGHEYIGTNYGPITPNTTAVIHAVLYKGEGSVIIDTSDTVTVSGNIQQMSSDGYLITGDGTITIS